MSSIKFSANLGFLWKDRPLPDAILAAGEAGFDAVECHWPYDTAPGQIKNALKTAGLPMLGLNTSIGDEGMFGLSALPHEGVRAKAAIMEALEYAEATATRAVHVMAGCAEGPAAQDTFLENLVFACHHAAHHQITILIEPINTFDIPGYFLHSLSHASSIIETVNHAALKMMFDCYHVARMGEEIAPSFKKYQSQIGHVQFAGVPHRGDPLKGSVHYREVFSSIKAQGYQGYFGAEYKPDETDQDEATDRSLEWLKNKRFD